MKVLWDYTCWQTLCNIACGMRATQWLSESPYGTKPPFFHPWRRRRSNSVSHLCTSSPCPSPAGPGTCGWPAAGLWSSSPGWPGSQRRTCTSAAPARSTPARRRTVRRTRTAGRCSPRGRSLQSRLDPTDAPCRRGGSPSAHTSASDRKSLSHPVWQRSHAVVYEWPVCFLTLWWNPGGYKLLTAENTDASTKISLCIMKWSRWFVVDLFQGHFMMYLCHSNSLWPNILTLYTSSICSIVNK